MPICASHVAVSNLSPSVYHSDADPNGKEVLRDVRERGRDIEGCIKQWFGFVKPNFHKYVEPQRNVAGELRLLYFSPTFCDDPQQKA